MLKLQATLLPRTARLCAAATAAERRSRVIPPQADLAAARVADSAAQRDAAPPPGATGDAGTFMFGGEFALRRYLAVDYGAFGQ